jgi:hypothetical protein
MPFKWQQSMALRTAMTDRLVQFLGSPAISQSMKAFRNTVTERIVQGRTALEVSTHCIMIVFCAVIQSRRLFEGPTCHQLRHE